MPRLHVYALIGGTVTSALWAFDKFYYTPSLTTKREMELFVEAEKAGLMNVYQAFSQIRDLSPFRNTERIALFCKIQMIRQDAFALPPNLLSAIDKSAMLRTLGNIQRQHCVSLRCREIPLTSEESWRCTLAFGIFVFAFRFVFPLLIAFRVCSDAALVHEAVKAAKLILDVIDVDVDMTVDGEASILVAHAAADDTNTSTMLLWHPSSWVEEAAFWGSSTNPWTQSVASVNEGRVGEGASDSAVLQTAVGFLGPKREQKQSPVERYEHRFQREYQALVDVANTSISTSKETFNVELPNTLFGYPSSLHDVALTFPKDEAGHERSHDSFCVPVVSVGIEKLTYMGEAFADRDVRAVKTGMDRYTDVYELQYGSGNILKNRQNNTETVAPIEPLQAVVVPFQELPLFSKESITCIFGGRPQRSGRRRTMFLHVGTPVVRSEAWKGYVGSYAELANRAAVVGV